VAEPARALWDATSYNKRAYQLGDEVERLGFDLKTTWRITNLNENYRYGNNSKPIPDISFYTHNISKSMACFQDISCFVMYTK